MQRAMVRLDAPLIHPHVCTFCGVGAGPYREWFIDLGIDVNSVYKAIEEGTIYVCNECLPGFIEMQLKILTDWRNEVMDNNLLKEEPSYGLVDGITGGSGVSNLLTGESKPEVSGTESNRGSLQILDIEESLPDTGYRSSTEANLGIAPQSEPDDPDVKPELPESKPVPSFRMGKRTN